MVQTLAKTQADSQAHVRPWTASEQASPIVLPQPHKTGGLYLYDAEANLLHMINAQDLRSATGEQDFVATAPLNLIYVADLARIEDAADRAEKKFYSAIDTGFICQNVYLFCASEGLATVVRGRVPRPRLAALIGLKPSQRIIVAQTVGFPG